MIQKRLYIGRWKVDFIFVEDEYDVDDIAWTLYEAGASYLVLDQAKDLMWMCDYNCGFTFSNESRRTAVVVIGPTTGGDEFLDTFVHEIHHLAVAIADSLGVDLESETPAYISGDTARDLAEIVCLMGCKACHPSSY